MVGKLAVKYANSPKTRSLLHLVPWWSSVDNLLQERYQEIAEERVTAFFDELASGEHELSEELIRTEDFLHRYFITTRAALNTRRREKIKMFARLLRASINTDLFSSIDEYEEYLSILDELSFRELQVLSILDRYESEYPAKEGGNLINRTDGFWEAFIQELINRLHIPENEVRFILYRLTRTGCYQPIIKTRSGIANAIGDCGILTSTYQRLRHLIEEHK